MAAPNIPAVKRAGLPVDLPRLAAEGDGWLTPEDRYALKTYGACAQAQPGVFMVRIRVPGGRVTRTQARGLADLADAHGESWIHVTTRQNLELHHVAARSVPSVLGAIDDLGLTSRSACGHTHRNVMACPDAGVGLDEPFDCGPDARAVAAAVVARAAELNVALPSRLNFAFGGCHTCNDHARLNDGGFVSVVVGGEPGYRLWAGGSLGTMPVLAVPLAEFVPRREAVAAALALTQAFIDLGDIDNPKKGRLKFVLESVGADAFRAAWRERFEHLRTGNGYAPEPVAVPGATRLAEVMAHRPQGGWGPGVRPQRTPGLALVTVNVTLGDLIADELRLLADLARLGDGHLYTTRNQNVQFRDVPVARVAALRRELAAANLGIEGADASVDVRACTGSAVCALAITAAPAAGVRVAASPLLARNGSLRVHVSGCPNSCAQHQAADIGLAGGKVRINGATRLGYTLLVGADLAAGRLAEPIGRVAEEDVEAAVSGVIGTWEALRRPGERLVETVDRVGADAFATHVASIAGGFEAAPPAGTPPALVAASA
ncbi:MAG TPA: nitrite/sulfite reductase [Acidimicrobiales bacterium]|nr:nitrite/sulfite reductase [Acidimicrobiales bacterium]